MTELDPLVEVQKELTPPDGRSFWTFADETRKSPTFTTGEVAKIFFGRGKTWLYKLLLGMDGRYDQSVDIPRKKGERRIRIFSLHTVELICHAFLEQGIIDLQGFRNAIAIIKALASIYRLL